MLKISKQNLIIDLTLIWKFFFKQNPSNIQPTADDILISNPLKQVNMKVTTNLINW